MPDHYDAGSLDKDILEPRHTLEKRKKRSRVDANELHDLDTGVVRTKKRIKKAAAVPWLAKGKKRFRVDADELHDLDAGDVRMRKRMEIAATEPWYLLYTLESQKLQTENCSSSGARPILLSIVIASLFDIFAVHLEHVLFYLTQGNIDAGANHASTSIEQEKQLESDPMANTVAGLAFYHVWFSTIPNVMRWKDAEPLNSPPPSDMLHERFRSLDADAERHTALYSLEANSHVKYVSDSSVMMEKRVPEYSPGERLQEVMVKTEDLTEAVKTEYLTEAVKTEYLTESSSQHNVQSQGFYLNSSENEVSLSNDAKRAHCAPILPELGVLDPIFFLYCCHKI